MSIFCDNKKVHNYVLLDPALVCGRGSPTSAAPTTTCYWGRKAGESSWPAAHGPGGGAGGEGPGSVLDAPNAEGPQAMRSMRVARPRGNDYWDFFKVLDHFY